MSADSIPDECLKIVLDCIEDPLVLFRCLQVCTKWYHLVMYRFQRIVNLLDKYSFLPHHISNSLCYYGQTRPLDETVLTAFLDKMTNLEVVSIGSEIPTAGEEGWLNKALDRLSQLESLKGIIINNLTEQVEANIPLHIPLHIEKLSVIDIPIRDEIYNGVKQLCTGDGILTKQIQLFPNLERLNLVIEEDEEDWYHVARKEQHLLKKITIVEIDTSPCLFLPLENFAIKFLDLCPLLESAHIRTALDQVVDEENVINLNLKNLVITYDDFQTLELYHAHLVNVLKRYPNIKHLAIRHDDSEIFDRSSSAEDDGLDLPDEVEALLERVRTIDSSGYFIPILIVLLLQHLVLLDMRGLPGINEASIDYVREYCLRRGRSIQIYFGSVSNDEIIRDWPQLFEPVEQSTREIAFMKQCFLKNYRLLPFFMNPF